MFNIIIFGSFIMRNVKKMLENYNEYIIVVKKYYTEEYFNNTLIN